MSVNLLTHIAAGMWQLESCGHWRILAHTYIYTYSRRRSGRNRLRSHTTLSIHNSFCVLKVEHGHFVCYKFLFFLFFICSAFDFDPYFPYMIFQHHNFRLAAANRLLWSCHYNLTAPLRLIRVFSNNAEYHWNPIARASAIISQKWSCLLENVQRTILEAFVACISVLPNSYRHAWVYVSTRTKI